MTPPQDWLHHDLCLLEELLKLKNYKNLNYEVEWSEERHRLDISGKGIISIKIGGGLSTNRSSAFQVAFKNNTKMLMDMIENKYYKFSSKGEAREFKFTNHDSLRIMVNHFINLSFDLSKNDDEKATEFLANLEHEFWISRGAICLWVATGEYESYLSLFGRRRVGDSFIVARRPDYWFDRSAHHWFDERQDMAQAMGEKETLFHGGSSAYQFGVGAHALFHTPLDGGFALMVVGWCGKRDDGTFQSIDSRQTR
jgi:hypothetical protein